MTALLITAGIIAIIGCIINDKKDKGVIDDAIKTFNMVGARISFTYYPNGNCKIDVCKQGKDGDVIDHGEFVGSNMSDLVRESIEYYKENSQIFLEKKGY